MCGTGLSSRRRRTRRSANGEKLYVDQKCAVCHSIGGKGRKKGPLRQRRQQAQDRGDPQKPIVDAKGMTTKTKAARKPVMRVYKLRKEDVDALSRT